MVFTLVPGPIRLINKRDTFELSALKDTAGVCFVVLYFLKCNSRKNVWLQNYS